jgi:hypothetical protein
LALLSSAARIHRYLYYRLYAWYLRKFGEHDVPHFSALCIMIIYTAMNVVTLPILSSALGHAPDPTAVKPVMMGSTLLAASVHWALLYRGERYREILREFEGEPPDARRRGTIGVTVYMVGTPALLFGLAFGTTPA